MLESQRTEEDEGKDDGYRISRRLDRLVFGSKKNPVQVDPPDMDFPTYGAGDEVLRDPSHASSRSWVETRERIMTETSSCCLDLGKELFVQTWRERPRDAFDVYVCVRRNLVALFLILASGVITWESSVHALRIRVDRSIVFPLYLPHAVALSLASVWTTAIAPGTLIGLYLVRLYMIWRGHLGFTSINTTVMFLVAVLSVMQSHTGAFFLRKCLCGGGTKRIPTIDTVVEALWFSVIVTVISLIYGTAISLCITLTPLVEWKSFWRFWGTWWLGVLAPMITITPLLNHLMAWECQPSFRKVGKLMECALVVAGTTALMVIVFFLNFYTFKPLPYLCFPIITWTAFRFNRVGWAFTVSAIAYSSALGTIRQRGSLYSMTAEPSVASAPVILQVELFSCIMGVIGITLAAAVREKKSLTRRLHQMNVELEHKVDLRTIELRKANEELQVSQRKAEQASHAKSDFLANMSHEIRTPIHGILGLTALLLESELTTDQKECLVSVKECADLLLHIINSVLDLAKIEAGRLEVEKVPFNIRKMVSSTFRMLQARAQERGLQLLLDVDRCVPQALVGDVGKLQQCLLNLVGNALKFTHEGSVSVRVTVATEQQKAGTYLPSNVDDEVSNKVAGTSAEKLSAENVVGPQFPENIIIRFEVSDTGIGISREKLLDMFNPFTQADASTSRLYGGTGLGLCIVQRFVELLGGTIGAESEMGKGSTFHFCLPFYLSSPKESPGEMSPKKVSSGKVHGQPWSLMGGLIFNPPIAKHNSEPSQLQSGPPSRNSNLSSRTRSANDLVGMWKPLDNKGSTIDDLAMYRDESTQEDFTSSKCCSSRGSSHGSGSKVCPSGLEKDLSNFPDRIQGGSLEGVEEHKVQHNAEKMLLDPGTSRIPFNQVSEPLKGDFNHSDRGATNDITPLVPGKCPSGSIGESWELVQLQNSMLASSSTARFPEWESELAVFRPHGCPMDSILLEGSDNHISGVECERGSVTGLALDAQGLVPGTTTSPLEVQNTYGDSAIAVSDLSRESSIELEKMLESKVHLKILLAEDNAINQKVASRQLEKHGHVVTIVGDGQQALDAIIAQHDYFDLILMDVQMPIMDGLRATEQIRKLERENGWVRVPILGLTAHAIQGYQDTCLKHGMDGYLGKPFDIQQLLKTIGHVLPSIKLSHQDTF